MFLKIFLVKILLHTILQSSIIGIIKWYQLVIFKITINLYFHVQKQNIFQKVISYCFMNKKY